MEYSEDIICKSSSPFPKRITGSDAYISIDYDWIINQLEKRTGCPLPTEIVKALRDMEYDR